MKYVKNLFIAFSQLLNCFLFGLPDETLSARLYRSEKTNHKFGKLFRPVIDLIFGNNHCKRAFENEVLRSQLPKDYDI